MVVQKSFSQPLLKCLGLKDGHYALRDVHKGIRGIHIRAKAQTRQVIKDGFFWPILKADSKEFMKKYKKCQLYVRVQRQLIIKMTTLTSLSLFTK